MQWTFPALGFGVAAAYWPGLLSAATAPRWCLLAVGLPLVAWLDPRRLDWRVLAVAGAFIAYASLSLLWTPDILTGADDLFRLLIIAVAFLAGAAIDDLDKVLAALAWGVALSVPFVLLQMAGISPLDVPMQSGLFFNREVLGETAAPLLVWALCTRRWPLSALLALAVALTLSRVGIVTVAGALAITYPRRAWLPLLGATLYANLAFALQWPLFGPVKLAGALQRLMVWEWALGGITWLGKGIGSFAALYPQAEYAHSDVLQLAFETGLIGLATGGFFLVALWRRSSGAHRALLVALAIDSALSYPLHMPVAALTAALLAGSLARSGDLVRSFRRGRGGAIGAVA